jgi:hypothetical protein
MYLERILANGKMRQFMDRCFGGGDEAVDGRFADTVDVGIGADLHEQPVLPSRAYCIGFNANDLHESFSDAMNGCEGPEYLN